MQVQEPVQLKLSSGVKHRGKGGFSSLAGFYLLAWHAAADLWARRASRVDREELWQIFRQSRSGIFPRELTWGSGGQIGLTAAGCEIVHRARIEILKVQKRTSRCKPVTPLNMLAYIARYLLVRSVCATCGCVARCRAHKTQPSLQASEARVHRLVKEVEAGRFPARESQQVALEQSRALAVNLRQCQKPQDWVDEGLFVRWRLSSGGLVWSAWQFLVGAHDDHAADL